MVESKPVSVSQAEFDQLQKKLVPLWKSIERFNQDPQTIVVVPSMSIDAISSGAVMQAYEERFLFLLLLLRQPRARLIYVTSQTILPSIIDYYLDLLPGVIPSHARQRLFLLSPLDGSVRPLSDKLLSRPRLTQRIRSLVMDPDRAHLVPFNTTNREKELALRLGIPMYGADPKFFPLGTKSGCRKIFVEENVPHPLGYENLGSKEDLIEAIAQMRAKKPSIKQVLVKLNEGVSGEGNAVIDLTGLPPSFAKATADRPVAGIGDAGHRNASAGPGSSIPATTDSGRARAMLEERLCRNDRGSSKNALWERSSGVPAYSFGSRRWARLNCYRRMTSFWVGHPGKATSAACSLPTPVTLR